MSRITACPARWILALPALLLPALSGMAMAAPPPLADIHTHYKWSQQEVTTPQQVLDTLRDNGIALAVVIGTPAETTLEISALDPARILPVWSPYRIGGDWSRWAFDGTVPARARQALATGRYYGIGELHLIGGFVPDWRSPVISGLIALGIESVTAAAACTFSDSRRFFSNRSSTSPSSVTCRGRISSSASTPASSGRSSPGSSAGRTR